MKFKLSRVALTTMSLLPLLTACGGGDNNNDYQPKEKTLEVTAIDGYLNGAQVWLDLNGNSLLDSNEPNSTTGAGGKAVLDVSSLKDQGSKYPLMVQVIANKTIDESSPTTPITQSYVMSAPAGYKVITPLTTLVQLQIQAGSTPAEAEANVKDLLQKADADLSADYVANKQTVLAGQAAVLVQLLPTKPGDLAGQQQSLEDGAKLLGELTAQQASSGKEVDLSQVALVRSTGGVVELDRDGDGVVDRKDAFPNDKSESLDTDKDGIGNNADADDDNDGWKDTTEIAAKSDPLDAKSVPGDIDGDGIADSEDDDIDGDGVANELDAFPFNKRETLDTDKDGIGNNADTDDDGDGWSDSEEKRLKTDALDPQSKPVDLDGDFVTDAEDEFPNDKSESRDTDKDGIGNNADTDMDNDGILNASDAFPTDRTEGKDSNNDGWGDFASSDDDGDGTPDSIQGSANPGSVAKDPAEVAAYTDVLFHYKRTDGDYTGWGLHLWNNTACDSLDATTLTGLTWDKPLLPESIDPKFGAVFRLKLKTGHGTCINMIAHNGGNKGLGGGDQKIDINYGNDVYGFDNDSHLYYEPHETAPLVLRGAAGHWLTTDTLAIQPVTDAVSYELWAAADGDADITQPDSMIHYPLVSGGTIDTVKLPQLKNWSAFQFKDGITADQAKALVKQELIAVALDKDGKAFSFTKVQIPGVLDDLYTKGDNDADEAKLGAYLENGTAKFRLWAPTARKVELYLYNAKKEPLSDTPVTMTLDPVTGIWAHDGDASLEGAFYRYRLQVLHPVTNKVEWLMTTDPYSVSLSTASRYSQLVDLDSADAKPDGWDSHTIPTMVKPEDNIIYEMHIRDFSSADTEGTPELNGKYLAFTEAERDSVKHLKELREAGLNTIELMPTYDIDTIPEEASRQVNLDDTVARLCAVKSSAASCSNSAIDKSKTFRELLEAMDPRTGDAQSLLADLNGVDGFNWGYDPYHYTTPEGSYATNSDGLSRIREYRAMVKAMHDMGYRVVQDVVYNHTNASGLFNSSVLDKTVPGYYHRLNIETGAVETSTCCQNTASEHRMFEKLVVDSMVTWTEAYKIDGFRMDLMEHLMKSSVEKALIAVQAVRPDSWIYGEGWNFGEVKDGARGVNATQFNMAGTGIGTFNDRLRDAVRGGSPFDEKALLETNLGFASAGSRFNADLNSRMDLIRIGMAGNLQDYSFTTADGTTKKGVDIDYGGVGAGYTKDPQEAINYVEKHDNQTLWDIIQYKAAADVTAADRARMEVVGQATVLLGQGVPFMHMGSELLRSKSMNRDSYDSGDWFNKVDFSKQTNNWNVGLPRADKDEANWPYILKALDNPNSVATPTDIAWSDARIKELLKVRSTTELLRLATADDIIKRVKFYNTGADYVPGVIMMGVDDGAAMGADLDANYDAIMVAINANTVEQTVYAGGTQGFELHPVFAASSDAQLKTAKFANGKFTLPPLSAVVFVKKQSGSAATGLDVAPLAETYYLRGSFTSDWAANLPLTYIGQGRYQAKISLTAKTYDFKLANSGWSSAYGGKNTTIASSSFAVTSGSDNLSITAKKAGEYTFTLDVSNNAKPVLNVIAPAITPAPYGNTGIYVMGSFDGWGAGTAFPYSGDNGLYLANMPIKAGTYQFKVADASWAVVNLGSAAVTSGSSGLVVVANGDNLEVTIPTDGEWQFVLDANDPKNPTLTIQETPNYTCYKNGDKACDLRMYQVMVESFVNGDDNINYDVGYGPSQHKGDLQGIIDSLDYIKSLKVNAIWLTPVFNSCGDSVTDQKLAATGYFACDYFTVDPKFGTNEKLKELVDAAHAKGLYVFLDGVFGHAITDQIPASPSGIVPVMKAAATGFTVDYKAQASIDFFKEVATHYVTEYGIDGWRLDQAYQVPPAVWTEIRTAVEAAAAARKTAGETWGTLGYMVGEVWNGAEAIAETAYGSKMASPALKSAFDFPLRYGVVQAIASEESGAKGDATKLNATWNDISNYPLHAMPNLMLTNHDLVRFGDLLERSGLVTGVSDPAYWLRNKAAFSFMAANSGPITLYYGDEIGDEVSDFSIRERDLNDGKCVAGTLCRDDDNIARSDAKIENVTPGFIISTEQADLKDYVTKLMEVRAAHPALFGGKRVNLAKSATLYVDLKKTFSEQVVYLLNTDSSATTYDLSSAGLSGATVKDLMTDEVISDLTAVPAPALTGRLLLVQP